MKFYKCSICGNIIAYVNSSGANVSCCGKQMTKIVPNTVDASLEKHVPVINIVGNKVTVALGSAPHPMIAEHYIEWVALETDKGNQRKELLPGQHPIAEFVLLEGEKVVAAYAYCNLHGLWKK